MKCNNYFPLSPFFCFLFPSFLSLSACLFSLTLFFFDCLSLLSSLFHLISLCLSYSFPLYLPVYNLASFFDCLFLLPFLFISLYLPVYLLLCPSTCLFLPYPVPLYPPISPSFGCLFYRIFLLAHLSTYLSFSSHPSSLLPFSSLVAPLSLPLLFKIVQEECGSVS